LSDGSGSKGRITLLEKSALVKQLMNHLHSKKGQERTLPSSLWMRYKAVEQKTLSFADLKFCFAGRSLRRSGW